MQFEHARHRYRDKKSVYAALCIVGYLIVPTHCMYVRVVEVDEFFDNSTKRKSMSSTNRLLLQLITRWPEKWHFVDKCLLTKTPFSLCKVFNLHHYLLLSASQTLLLADVFNSNSPLTGTFQQCFNFKASDHCRSLSVAQITRLGSYLSLALIIIIAPPSPDHVECGAN